jgi:hypothetical protein
LEIDHGLDAQRHEISVLATLRLCRNSKRKASSFSPSAAKVVADTNYFYTALVVGWRIVARWKPHSLITKAVRLTRLGLPRR